MSAAATGLVDKKGEVVDVRVGRRGWDGRGDSGNETESVFCTRWPSSSSSSSSSSASSFGRRDERRPRSGRGNLS